MTITKRTSRANVAGGPTSITRKKKDEKKQNWITVKKPVIATKPKGDPTGQGLRGQALTGATVKRARGGTVEKVKPRGFSRMLPSKRPVTKIYRSQGR
jgi:hypothetical protein